MRWDSKIERRVNYQRTCIEIQNRYAGPPWHRYRTRVGRNVATNKNAHNGWRIQPKVVSLPSCMPARGSPVEVQKPPDTRCVVSKASSMRQQTIFASCVIITRFGNAKQGKINEEKESTRQRGCKPHASPMLITLRNLCWKLAGTKHRSHVQVNALLINNWEKHFPLNLKLYFGLWLGLEDGFCVVCWH